MPNSLAPAAPDQLIAPAAVPSITLPAVLPEPKAGGNYLRDPVTGALTLNPDHPTAAGTQE